MVDKNLTVNTSDYVKSLQEPVKIKGWDMMLVPIDINAKYLEKWNQRSNDFCCLIDTKTGNIINNNLFRLGGLFQNNGYDYLHLIVHFEELYDENLHKNKKLTIEERRHLNGKFCLLKKDGKITKVFDKFSTSYLLCNSVYSNDRSYYNTYTNELICKSHNQISSKNYLFLESNYDNPNPGVYKVCKKTGKFEIID